MAEIAISVEHLDKMYKLYDKPMDRLKESLGLTRKKKYREHYALRDVSFDVHRGETVGIIGTNGSGKSTILKIITGVLNPTAGEVRVNGRISALLELGAGFNMEYSGLENVYLNGTMIGFSKEEIDAKLDAILSFADIGDFIHQPVKTYSSGMFVRLAFAVAINIDPEILIVDEALSVGDVFFQAKCYRKFEEFKKALKENNIDKPVSAISSVTHSGVSKLMQDAANLVEEVEKERSKQQSEIQTNEKVKEYKYKATKKNDFTVEKIDEHVFVVKGESLERLVQRINIEHQDGIMLLARKLNNLGVDEALRQAGAENGDDVAIGDFKFECIQ